MNYPLTLIILFLVPVLGGVSACKGNPTVTKQAGQEKQAKQEPEEIAVGRLTFLEKNVFMYLRDTEDWSLLVRDVPVKDGDVLYSDVQGRSEVTFPNKTWIRINDATKIQVDAIKRNQTLVYINSGVARVHNRATDTAVQVETPYGTVLSRQPSTFDIYIGDSSVAVTALDGMINFVDRKNSSFEVKPGVDSLLADESSVVSFQRFLDETWDGWNNERDNELRTWANNLSPFLPEQLQSDAKTLEDNGNWQRVTYEGETADYWTPTNVPAGWSPFTVGQWTIWHQEQLWVPYEPFGWVTHHYGGWIFMNNRWYWRPPQVVTGNWVVPWYPARVVWVYQGDRIAWVPLSYREVYYGRHYWGPRTVVVNEQINIRNFKVNRYLNVNRAVVVEKDKLYREHRSGIL